ncbi:helix-turn-helix domain-containing protein [Micromonospora sp. NPDC047548]|uniref:helix-turn-helix domain-containing protein n=1 Tax=Micromonospora sp. NPDC047548 TaxID=3155624 RepID=UPI0033DCAC24
MQLRYNYRVYPDASQRGALSRAFGCARVVFNDGLRARQTPRENGLPYVSDGELSKQVITAAKQTLKRNGWARCRRSSCGRLWRTYGIPQREIINRSGGPRPGAEQAFAVWKDFLFGRRFSDRAAYAAGVGTRRLYSACP